MVSSEEGGASTMNSDWAASRKTSSEEKVGHCSGSPLMVQNQAKEERGPGKAKEKVGPRRRERRRKEIRAEQIVRSKCREKKKEKEAG